MVLQTNAKEKFESNVCATRVKGKPRLTGMMISQSGECLKHKENAKRTAEDSHISHKSVIVLITFMINNTHVQYNYLLQLRKIFVSNNQLF